VFILYIGMLGSCTGAGSAAQAKLASAAPPVSAPVDAGTQCTLHEEELREKEREEEANREKQREEEEIREKEREEEQGQKAAVEGAIEEQPKGSSLVGGMGGVLHPQQPLQLQQQLQHPQQGPARPQTRQQRPLPLAPASPQHGQQVRTCMCVCV